MKDRLIHSVKQFLLPRWHPEKPFLLGYSGGPDSKALLYVLLACQKQIPFQLHLVHINHGWREESDVEALSIINEAAELGLQLHLHRLNGQSTSVGNMEAIGREARFLFFNQIYMQVGAQGLFLAHHADDQSETVLKRLLEGAHLTHWRGIQADCQMGQIRLLRPLLEKNKKELLKWLKHHGKMGFEDMTNLDSRFLRGRMRCEIIPSLSAQFGKEVSGNLCKIARLSHDIHLYLSRKCFSYFDCISSTEEGIAWDLTEVTEQLELNWIIKQWVDRENLRISRDLLEKIVDGLKNKTVVKKISVNKGFIYCDKGVLFYSEVN